LGKLPDIGRPAWRFFAKRLICRVSSTSFIATTGVELFALELTPHGGGPLAGYPPEMRIMAPYTGGLLRLAVTTIAILAVFAAVWEYLQQPGRTSGQTAELEAVTAVPSPK
jgi:hypothetical protein